MPPRRRDSAESESIETEPSEAESPATGRPWARRASIAALLALLVACGTFLRVRTVLVDPSFDAEDARGLLKSDPGLLYYLTERIVDAGGLPPEDFRADPRIEHPGTSDVPAMFAVGQELVVAWGYLALGGSVPLHVVALWLMSVCASLTVLGVYGLAYELTNRKHAYGITAALLYLVLPGNYRTIGFLLIREDFSIPWLALHLYLFARAVRVRTIGAASLAALALVLAAATWHAMGFMLTIEAGVVLGWFLWTGQNPLCHASARVVPVVAVLGSLAVPVLLAKGFLFSAPMLVLLALALAGELERRRADLSPLVLRLSAPAAMIALLLASKAIAAATGFGRSDYSHVAEFMTAKLTHLGRLPDDPNELTFDTRLLWQGPFETPTLEYLVGSLGIGLLLVGVAAVWGARGWLRRRDEPRVLVLMGVVVGGFAAALLVKRSVILPAFLTPVVGAVLSSRLPRGAARQGLSIAALVVQVPLFATWIVGYRCPWYLPTTFGDELAQTVRWIEANVPAHEAVCSDFVTSTAILAHARNPILVQPKYETTSSRRRIQTFMETFMNGTLKAFRELLVENDCRYVVTNFDYWSTNAYKVGLVLNVANPPDPRTPFFHFCHADLRVPQALPGYELLFASKAERGPGLLRVFRMREAPGR